MIGVDLFSGAGGMSLGATWADVSVKVAIDLNPSAVTTFRANHPGVRAVTADLASLRPIEIERRKNDCVVVFGGPPCRGFSASNQRTRNLDNPSNWLFSAFLRQVTSLHPDWAIFENVRGILETEGGFFFDRVVSGLKREGYTVTHWLLNAAEFGVPQRRWRVFIIASRHGITPKPPVPILSEAVTVRQAIFDLPVLRNGASLDRRSYRLKPHSDYARQMRKNLKDCTNHLVSRNDPEILKRYKFIPRGGNWKDVPAALMQSYAKLTRCHTGIYRRLKLDAASVVIGNFRKNMLIHPTQTRGLSVREAAQIGRAS